MKECENMDLRSLFLKALTGDYESVENLICQWNSTCDHYSEEYGDDFIQESDEAAVKVIKRGELRCADELRECKMTCNTCKANRVCDHNKYGFENCNSYIPVDVTEKKLNDLLYVIRNNMTSITRYVRHEKSKHPALTEGQFLDRNLEYKELAKDAVNNILEYINGKR